MGVWVPHPKTVLEMVDSGTSDMGTVIDRSSQGRFNLTHNPATGAEIEKYVLVYWRARFGEAGNASGAAGSADLTIRTDHHLRIHEDPSGTTMNQHSYLIDTIKKVGIGDNADVSVIIRPEEYPVYTFHRNTILVWIWTNPDTSQEQRWDLEVGLAPVVD